VQNPPGKSHVTSPKGSHSQEEVEEVIKKVVEEWEDETEEDEVGEERESVVSEQDW
jgi:hypothetical protein